MNSIWVCKHDGSIQCEPGGGLSLKEMRRQLAELIGEENILKMEQRSVTVIQVCGAPTGKLNAYLITEEGWRFLNDGIRGRQGFESCDGEDPPIPQPVQIQELIGRLLRVYKTGDIISQDFRPNRVNIETDDQDVVVRIWFG
jgi:hypothetical protein